MKYLLLAIFGCAFAIVLATPINNSQSRKLGAKECTWGPGFWCSNITNAKRCNAFSHCVQTVWEKQTVPEDTDSICKICTDMVTQARDQLESNETQNDLKAVFEGSCRLIPVKVINKECVKMVDNFIPELVEALASQMNPQVVCSVAGLCNNARIDELLANTPVEPAADSVEEDDTSRLLEASGKLSCSGCNNVASLISNKFHASNRDDILENMLGVCGQMSSFSDACANILLTNFNEIYDELSRSMNSDAICHVSGVCASNFHEHPELVEIRPMGNVGVVPVKDDIPCELCEQLVKHLRDLLVANTTEIEFKTVLEGLCNQTQGFRSECLSIVDQYYDVIYHTLVSNLDANGACYMIGVCPKGAVKQSTPYMPLLPPATVKQVKVLSLKAGPKFPNKVLGENEPLFKEEDVLKFQLPIDTLMGAPNSYQLVNSGEFCTLCEYFLHFLQEQLSTPNTEDEIKNAVYQTCEKLPRTIKGECHDFVEMYGDAVIALLIQNIDPREICPRMKMCPNNAKDSEVFAPRPIMVNIDRTDDKPKCPLCLFSVTEAEQMIRSDKSKANIKKTLNNLCVHLPQKLRSECSDFVETYTAELIEMLAADFTPQQICVYLKLCKGSGFDGGLELSFGDGDVLTNEIPDNTVNGRENIVEIGNRNVGSPTCLLCEEVVREVEKKVVNKKSKEQIKFALEHACDKVPKKGRKPCHDFVDKHGDQIAELIMQEMAPKEVCRALALCSFAEEQNAPADLDFDEALIMTVVASPSNTYVIPFDRFTGMEDWQTPQSTETGEPPQCVMCEFIMVKIEQELANKSTQDEIKHTIEHICEVMPKTVSKKCNTFIDQYANLIISLVDTVPPKQICAQINLCSKSSFADSMPAKESTAEVLECAVCHGATQALSSLLEDPKFDRKIENVVEKTCGLLPAKYYEKCSDLVEVYGPSMIHLIVTSSDLQNVCAKIGMCFPNEFASFPEMDDMDSDEAEKVTTSPTTVHKRSVRSVDKRKLLGKGECSYGPSFWCKSKSNAFKCNALKYCTSKAWKNNKKI